MDTTRLQARIDALLINPATGKAWQRFSPYLGVVALDLQEKLEQAGKDGGLDALLNEFDKLRLSEDLHQLRIALANVLHNNADRVQLGLRVP